MKTLLVTPLLCAVLTASFSACLGPTDALREPNLFSLAITLPDASLDHYVGNDTLTVLGYKMLIDTISVGKEGNTDEKFEPKPLLAEYIVGFGDHYQIAAGVVGAGIFNGIRYSIVRPALNTDLIDMDLVERDENTGVILETYSISVTGIRNGKIFRFRSQVSKAVHYDFLTSVELPDYNAYLETRLRGNWKQWFVDSSGTQILDPDISGNRNQIEENILKYFDVFTFSLGEVSR